MPTLVYNTVRSVLGIEQLSNVSPSGNSILAPGSSWEPPLIRVSSRKLQVAPPAPIGTKKLQVALTDLGAAERNLGRMQVALSFL